MSHQIYHTEGFILRGAPSREADKIFKIFTRDLGLVSAPATGVRKLSSKLRFALQDFSYARIDLVRGRDTWRVTSASTISSFPYAVHTSASLKIIAQIAKLLERLCQGEEPNEEIFLDLVSACQFLDRPDVTAQEQEATELTVVLRILHNLGYIGNTEVLAHYLTERFSPEDISYEKLAKKTILFEINRALKESQL